MSQPVPFPKSRIGIFGTSANPPTGDVGHCGLLRYMVSTGKFDEIWVLPVYIHMFAAKRNLESFEHRVAMCKLCMEPLSTPNCTVRVLALEKHVFEQALEEYNLKQQHHKQQQVQQQQQVPQPRIGSIDIVRFIKNKYKNIEEVHLILGTDTCRDLLKGTWRESENLVKETFLDLITRPGFEKDDRALDTLPLFSLARITVHEIGTLEEVSSTAVRGYEPPGTFQFLNSDLFQSLIGLSETNIKVALTGPVYDYIRDNQLYFFSPQACKERRQRNFERHLARWGGPVILGIAAVIATLIGSFVNR